MNQQTTPAFTAPQDANRQDEAEQDYHRRRVAGMLANAKTKADLQDLVRSLDARNLQLQHLNRQLRLQLHQHQEDNAQEHNIQTAEWGSGHAQDSNASTPGSTPQEPTLLACTGLASPDPQEATEGAELSCNGLTDPAPVDPHEVRARLTRRGPVHGLELDTGTGVVFIPQHALPDLRRRLVLAQERFTAMSGSVPGKRRRRPAGAR